MLPIPPFQLYQIYAKASPEEVYDVLRRYNSSYIILEDSICLAAGSNGRCNLPTTMDLANGHVSARKETTFLEQQLANCRPLLLPYQIPDDGVRDPPHLVPSKHPRFCDEIRRGKGKYGQLFGKVFENRTFRVYKVLT